MKRNTLFAAVAALLVGLPPAVFAEGADSGPHFSFGASASFGYDFNDPDSTNPNIHQHQLSYSSQEQDESFNIDLVQVGMHGQRGPMSYEAKLSFGDLASHAGDSADGDIALQVAYLTYDFGPVAATAGRFETPIGYEVLEPWGNANISRSRVWHAQPENHDGITVGGTVDIVDWMLGVANSFTVEDQQIGANDLDDEKAILASIGAPIGDDHAARVSGIYTQENDFLDIWMINAIVSGLFAFGDLDVSYALVGNTRTDDPDIGGDMNLWNVGAYAGVDVGPGGIDVRIDFTDDEGIETPGNIDAEVTSVTVTGSMPLAPGVDVRLEYRYDTSNEDVFGDGSDPDDTMNLVQAQIVWHPEAN